MRCKRALNAVHYYLAEMEDNWWYLGGKMDIAPFEDPNEYIVRYTWKDYYRNIFNITDNQTYYRVESNHIYSTSPQILIKQRDCMDLYFSFAAQGNLQYLGLFLRPAPCRGYSAKLACIKQIGKFDVL